MNVPSFARWIGWISLILVAASIGTALWIVGSPANARKSAADSARQSSLQMLQNEVETYYQDHKALPKSVRDLNFSVGLSAIKDPVTNQPLEYAAIDSSRYRLCAVFETDTRNKRTGSWDTFGRHPVGRFCFELDAKR